MTDHMSGGGTLQQRTTYLISLTLVKVEAVDENGAQGKEAATRSNSGMGGRPGKEDAEDKSEAQARAQNGAEVLPEQPESAENAATKKGKITDLKDGEKKLLSPFKDKPYSNPDVLNKVPPCNLSIPLPAEKTSAQKTGSILCFRRKAMQVHHSISRGGRTKSHPKQDKSSYSPSWTAARQSAQVSQQCGLPGPRLEGG